MRNIGIKISNRFNFSKCGDNIGEKSSNIKWYDEKVVSEVLDEYDIIQNVLGPLRLPVQDIYKIKDKRVIVGRIEPGKVAIDDELLFTSNETVRIDSLKNGQAKKRLFCW